MEAPKIAVSGNDQSIFKAVRQFNHSAVQDPALTVGALDSIISGVEPAIMEQPIVDAARVIAGASQAGDIRFDSESWARFTDNETRRRLAARVEDEPRRTTIYRYLGFYASELAAADAAAKLVKKRRSA